MENLTFHDLWLRIRETDASVTMLYFQGFPTADARRDLQNLHIEREHRIRTWSIMRLLRIIFETRDYAERMVYLILLCDERIEPIFSMTRVDTTRQMIQDLQELLQFKEQYTHNGIHAQGIEDVLRRYSIDNILIKIDELKNEIIQNNQMSDLAFMQATHHRLGAHAPVNNLSDDLLGTIARSAHF